MGRKSQFSEEERIHLAREYASKKITLGEIKSQYGISVSKGMIASWIKKYRISKCYSKKALSLPPEPKMEDHMADTSKTKSSAPDTEELLSRIASLEKDLRWEKMRTHALETLIDVAEENGLKIRKKSGAKQ